MFERVVSRFAANISAKARKDTLEGRDYLVAPCAMLGEEVLNGSQGPIFYPKDENAKDPSSWNHMPIVVYHPSDNGTPISARNHTVLNERKIGLLLNTVHDGKLKTECWFDVERTKALDMRIYNAVDQGKQIETSTGLSLDLERKEGEHNGTKYIGIAHNYRPDHLAILPDLVGAYSIKMGGGLFANAAKEPESTALVMSKTVEKLLSNIKVEMVDNEMSFSVISRTLCDLLSQKYGKPGKYWDGWIEATYSDKVIFWDEGDLYLMGYKATDTAVTLEGDRVVVKRVMEYRTADGGSYVGNAAGGLDLTTPDGAEQLMFKKKDHIDKLVGNGFEEKDRAELEKLPDAVLEKIQPKAPTTNTTPPVVPPAPPPAPPVTLNDLIGSAPVEVQEQFAEIASAHNTAKTTIIQRILAANGNTFTEADLRGMKMPQLRSISSLIPEPVQNNGLPNLPPPITNFSAAAGGPPVVGNNAGTGTNNAKKPTPLKVPVMDFEPAKS